VITAKRRLFRFRGISDVKELAILCRMIQLPKWKLVFTKFGIRGRWRCFSYNGFTSNQQAEAALGVAYKSSQVVTPLSRFLTREQGNTVQ